MAFPSVRCRLSWQSSPRFINRSAAPGFVRSGRRKRILPISIIGLILIISAVSAIVIQPQQASASTRVPDDGCTAYVSATITVAATCGGNIISKPCSSNNVIRLSLVTSNNEVHWVCYGGALTSQETDGHNGGTVTFNLPIQINGIDSDGWSGYFTTTDQQYGSFYNGLRLNYSTEASPTITALVVSDDSR